MSPIFTNSMRALALAGVLLVAGRVPAATAQDPSPQRALLNSVPAPRLIPIVLLERSSAWAPADRPVTGEAALLVRVAGTVPSQPTPSGNVTPIDGGRALLGRWPANVARLTALSAGSQ